MRATNNKIITPVKTGKTTYKYPNAFIFAEPVTAIKAVAPPGGCKVFVCCIAITESDTAKGAVSQTMSGKI